MKDKAIPSGAQAVERALSILEYVALANKPATVDEIAENTRLHRNTAYRLIRALAARDYLDVEDGTYSLGPMAIVLGQSTSRDKVLLRMCEPHLQELCETIGEVVNLGLLRQWEIFYLGRWEPSEPTPGIYVRTGQRAPLYASALGKMMLASMSLRDREAYYSKCQLIRYTRHTITNLDQLRAIVAMVEERGYGEDVEEISEGVRCIAKPIVANKEVVGVASISIPTVRFSEEKKSRHLKELEKAVARIGQELSLPRLVAP